MCDTMRYVSEILFDRHFIELNRFDSKFIPFGVFSLTCQLPLPTYFMNMYNFRNQIPSLFCCCKPQKICFFFPPYKNVHFLHVRRFFKSSIYWREHNNRIIQRDYCCNFYAIIVNFLLQHVIKEMFNSRNTNEICGIAIKFAWLKANTSN